MKYFPAIIFVLILLLSACKNRAGNKPVNPEAKDSLITENIFPFQAQHCHGSTIVTLPGGDLLVAWFQGSGERTADDVAILGSRYTKKSGKWSTPFIMADVPGFPDINPVLFIDKSRRLWLVWYTVMAYQWETSLLKYRISDDYLNDGPPVWKWQEMIHVKPDGSTPDGIAANDSFTLHLDRKISSYFAGLDSTGFFSGETGRVMKNLFEKGREQMLDISLGKNLMRNGYNINEKGERTRSLVGYPLMRRIGWQTRNKPLLYGNRILLPLYSDGFDFSLIAMTDDEGSTWKFSEPIVGAGAVQPSMLLRRDGRITAYMRDNGPVPQRLMMTVSADSGKTWSVVHDSEIPNPGSAADFIMLRNGNWAFVGNDLDEGRHRLSVWMSEDEGATWPWKKTIVNGDPGSQVRAHYPAISQDENGIIHVSYTNQVASPDGKSSVKNIAHAKFSEAWLKSN